MIEISDCDILIAMWRWLLVLSLSVISACNTSSQNPGDGGNGGTGASGGGNAGGAGGSLGTGASGGGVSDGAAGATSCIPPGCNVQCCAAAYPDQIAAFHAAVWSECPSSPCNICPACKVYPGTTPVFEPTADCYKCLVLHAEPFRLPLIQGKCNPGACDDIAKCVADCDLVGG